MPRTASRKGGSGGGGGKAEYFTAYDAHTTENVNSLVFPVARLFPAGFPARLSFPRGSRLPSRSFAWRRAFLCAFLLRLVSFFFSFLSFFSLSLAPPRPPPLIPPCLDLPRAREKSSRAERTDGVNPSAREKQKADRRLLSFTRLWRLRRQKERTGQAELLQPTVKYPDTSSWNSGNISA